MRIEIELTAVLGERRVFLGRLPLKVDLGVGSVTLSEGGIELTHREREVLDQMLLGKTHKEIGAALQISESTAKFHAAALYKKYRVNSRADLLRKIGELGE
jgi:DNA-binding CsgD family transcriptional regulator